MPHTSVATIDGVKVNQSAHESVPGISQFRIASNFLSAGNLGHVTFVLIVQKALKSHYCFVRYSRAILWAIEVLVSTQDHFEKFQGDMKWIIYFITGQCLGNAKVMYNIYKIFIQTAFGRPMAYHCFVPVYGQLSWVTLFLN